MIALLACGQCGCKKILGAVGKPRQHFTGIFSRKTTYICFPLYLLKKLSGKIVEYLKNKESPILLHALRMYFCYRITSQIRNKIWKIRGLCIINSRRNGCKSFGMVFLNVVISLVSSFRWPLINNNQDHQSALVVCYVELFPRTTSKDSC